ncbi:MAG: hypothetical protein KGR99_08275 [Betaproteobacteria bacterium]|nr:hypothetical protein [Betaproteobacteria bacterium]MBU6512293.1 hypothetical protein [Betaproteobacteria bacterium]MDE2477673.1 hypothetical protein [Betaproteobacteria bacterium]
MQVRYGRRSARMLLDRLPQASGRAWVKIPPLVLKNFPRMKYGGSSTGGTGSSGGSAPDRSRARRSHAAAQPAEAAVGSIAVPSMTTATTGVGAPQAQRHRHGPGPVGSVRSAGRSDLAGMLPGGLILPS